jgi:hypothetical protein
MLTTSSRSQSCLRLSHSRKTLTSLSIERCHRSHTETGQLRSSKALGANVTCRGLAGAGSTLVQMSLTSKNLPRFMTAMLCRAHSRHSQQLHLGRNRYRQSSDRQPLSEYGLRSHTPGKPTSVIGTAYSTHVARMLSNTSKNRSSKLSVPSSRRSTGFLQCTTKGR